MCKLTSDEAKKALRNLYARKLKWVVYLKHVQIRGDKKDFLTRLERATTSSYDFYYIEVHIIRKKDIFWGKIARISENRRFDV